MRRTPSQNNEVARVALLRDLRAEARLHRTIDWVVTNRRTLASWICLVGGLLLFGDGLVSIVLASYQNVEPGDTMEVYETRQVERTLS